MTDTGKLSIESYCCVLDPSQWLWPETLLPLYGTVAAITMLGVYVALDNDEGFRRFSWSLIAGLIWPVFFLVASPDLFRWTRRRMREAAAARAAP